MNPNERSAFIEPRSLQTLLLSPRDEDLARWMGWLQALYKYIGEKKRGDARWQAMDLGQAMHSCVEVCMGSNHAELRPYRVLTVLNYLNSTPSACRNLDHVDMQFLRYWNYCLGLWLQGVHPASGRHDATIVPCHAFAYWCQQVYLHRYHLARPPPW